MTRLVPSFDADLSRWAMTAATVPGPAGVATVSLTPGVRLEVDALDGSLLRVTVDSDDSAGLALDDLDLGVLRRFGAAPGRLFGGDLAPIDLDAEACEIGGRLAVLSEAARQQSFLGLRTAWWDAEANALRRMLGVADIALESSEPGAASAAAEALLEPIEWGDDARSEWADTCVAPFETPRGVTRSVVAPSNAIALADHIGDLPLGALPLGGDGEVALDTSWLPPGLVDLSRGAVVRRDRADHLLQISTDLAPGMYAAEVQQLVAVIIDETSDVITALSSLQAGWVAGRAVATAELTVGGNRQLDDLYLLITAHPSRLPSARLRRARSATGLSRAAARADRLGDEAAARRLLDDGLTRWASVDREFDRGTLRFSGTRPFLGELVESGRRVGGVDLW